MNNQSAINLSSKSELVYRSIVEHSIAAIFLSSPVSGNIYFANPSACSMFGYSEEEFLTLHRSSIFLPDEALIRGLEERKKTGKFGGVLTAIRKNGEHFMCEVSSVLFKDLDGELKASTTLIDISDRKNAEEELKKINERYKLATRASFDAIWDADLSSQTIYWGEGFEKLFGYHVGDHPASANTWESNIHPDDKTRVLEQHYQIINENNGPNFWSDEYRFIRVDGTVAYVIDRGLILRDDRGKAIRIVGAMQDITALKMKEQELIQKETQKQKAISQAIMETQEKERAEIGKELHDNINQWLTTTKLYLDLAISDSGTYKDLIQKSSKNILHLINEIRNLSEKLLLPGLGDLGLIAAVTDLTESINLTQKLRVDFVYESSIEKRISPERQLIIYRIIQEAMNNCLKYAEAKSVLIHLDSGINEIQLTVSDDGKGFDPSGIKKGTGLKNIQNRVYLVNGKFEIQSKPGRGCEIIIFIPLENNSQDNQR